jgi:hypothetical protein
MAQVGLASDVEKLLPGAAPRVDTRIALQGARGEVVSLQVCVQGPCRIDDIAVPGGLGPVPEAKCFVFREDWADLQHSSGLPHPDVGGWTGRTPDGLVPKVDDVVGEARWCFPRDVAQGDLLCHWLDFHIPLDAPAGTHQGRVKVSLAGQADAWLQVELRIWRFALPVQPSVRSWWGLYYNSLAQPHRTSLPDRPAVDLLARYVQLALDHRMCIGGLDLGTAGRHEVTAAAWNAAFLKFVRGEAATQTPGLRFSAVSDNGAVGPGSVVGSGDKRGSKAAFWQNAVANGFEPLVFDYTTDEPGSENGSWDVIREANGELKRIDRRFRSLVTTNFTAAREHGLLDAIDILCCLLNHIEDKPDTALAGNQRPRYDAWLAGDARRELWLYQSCMSHGCGGTGPYFDGWTSYAIDASMLRHRAMGWLLYRYGASGELYWDTTWAYGNPEIPGNPWYNGQWDPRFTGNGDGHLFCPGSTEEIGGATDVPCATLRMKAIRAGYSDYEYLKLLEGLRDGAGRAMADAMFPNPWTQPDVRTFRANRAALGERIDRLLGPAPQPGPRPPPAPNGPGRGWTAAALLGGWRAAGGGEPEPAYRLDAASGLVKLRGAVAGGAPGTAALALPEGCRPATTQRRVIVSDAAAAVASVAPDGAVRVAGPGAVFHLDAVWFEAER